MRHTRLLPTHAAWALLAVAAAAPGLIAGTAFALQLPTLRPDGMLTEAQVYDGYGCTGRNLSPAMSWSGAPPGTRSFAVTLYDPDAPTGSGWWHWLLYDIPPGVTSLPEGAGTPDGRHLPAGAAQGRTDFGTPGFVGACPPHGDRPHRYVFTVYALKTDRIDVPADATAATIGFALNANQLAHSSITARYAR